MTYMLTHADLNVLRSFIGQSILERYGEAFQRVMEKYMLSYLNKGAKPPAGIAPVILNMAEDYMNGRPIDLRAGDLFALENYFSRKQKTVK